MISKNRETLLDFKKYCQKHPEQRFWQALRNWSERSFVLFSDTSPAFMDGVDKLRGVVANLEDTFYREGK